MLIDFVPTWAWTPRRPCLPPRAQATHRRILIALDCASPPFVFLLSLFANLGASATFLCLCVSLCLCSLLFRCSLLSLLSTALCVSALLALGGVSELCCDNIELQ